MTRAQPGDLLSVGELARRAGVSVSTIHYYEQRELIRSQRTGVNHRRFPRHTLRRLAVVAAGQVIGLTLAQIGHALDELPTDRAPTRHEWSQMGVRWAALVERRILALQALQSSLDGCIGCGCLSLERCTLFNPEDAAAAEGPGSRWLRSAEQLPHGGGERRTN